MEKVVFMDRDGTINEEVHYLHRSEDLVLYPDVADGIRRLNEAGFKTVIITNQAGVARGYYKEEDVEALHQYLNEELKKSGAHIDAFFYCPHHPEYGIGTYKTDCECRKPKTGMFFKAEELYEIDKEHSYMIGDKLIDIEAGCRYGVRGILVGTGYGREFHDKVSAGEEKKIYDRYADNFKNAVDWILAREKEIQDIKDTGHQ